LVEWAARINDDSELFRGFAFDFEVMWPSQKNIGLFYKEKHGIGPLSETRRRPTQDIIIVRDTHGGGWSRKINARYLHTLMVYL
jgi:hypothetical protein